MHQYSPQALHRITVRQQYGQVDRTRDGISSRNNSFKTARLLCERHKLINHDEINNRLTLLLCSVAVCSWHFSDDRSCRSNGREPLYCACASICNCPVDCLHLHPEDLASLGCEDDSVVL